MQIPPAAYPLDVTEAEAARGFARGTFSFRGVETPAVVLDLGDGFIAVKALPEDADGEVRYGVFRGDRPIGGTGELSLLQAVVEHDLRKADAGR